MADLVYKSAAPLVDRESATLVITCSSNTYAPYVREFLEKSLKLSEGTYDHLALPGGPQFLLLTEYLPKFAWAGQRWVRRTKSGEHHPPFEEAAPRTGPVKARFGARWLLSRGTTRGWWV